MNKQQEPRLRFKEFAGAWEEKVLGENASFTKGSGYSKSDLTDSGFPIILYGRLYTKYENIIENVDTFVSCDKNALKSLGNEVIVPASGETAEDIARASAVYQQDVILGGDLNIITPNENIASPFLALTLTNGKSNQELAKKAQGKSVVHLRNDDLRACKISFPSFPEQTHLGLFFRRLDSQIAESRAVLEKSRQLKKAMLAKMIPANGEKIPKIRFKGFEGEWEEKGFESVGEFNPKTEIPQIFQYVDLESVVGTQLISYREEFKETAPSRAQRLAKNGDLFFQAVRPYQKNNYLFEKNNENFVFSTGYIQIRPRNDGYFLLTLVQKEEFVQEVLLRCTGTSYPAINASSLQDIAILIPQTSKEQTAIGNFFRQLDETIALQSAEVEKLNQLKKGLLSAMLV